MAVFKSEIEPPGEKVQTKVPHAPLSADVTQSYTLLKITFLKIHFWQNTFDKYAFNKVAKLGDGYLQI